MRTPPMPAAASPSASSMVVQEAPIAPARTSLRAISGHLCDLACGRNETPLAAAHSDIFRMLASRALRSMRSAGVLTSLRCIENPLVALGPSCADPVADLRQPGDLALGQMDGDLAAVIELEQELRIGAEEDDIDERSADAPRSIEEHGFRPDHHVDVAVASGRGERAAAVEANHAARAAAGNEIGVADEGRDETRCGLAVDLLGVAFLNNAP